MPPTPILAHSNTESTHPDFAEIKRMQQRLVLIDTKECLDYNFRLDGVHQAMSSETYKAPVVCKNCELKGYHDFPKGTPIEKAPCPNCGCMTLRKPDTYELNKIKDPFGFIP